MRIRQSLRLYVLAIMLVTGVSLVFVLSALSVNYFITGLDVGMKRMLVVEALRADVSDGKPFERLMEGRRWHVDSKVVISSAWQDQPQGVRESFNPNDIGFRRLEKKMIDGGWFYLTPPRESFFITKVKVGQNIRYAYIHMLPNEELKIGKFNHFHVIFLTAFAAIIVFSLVLVMLMRTISAPVGRLKHWASTIETVDLEKPVPDFRYSELNSLAEIIQNSLSSVHESAERKSGS